MSDLIERLRDRSGFVERGPMALMQHCEEAAAELARLTAEVERLRADAERWANYRKATKVMAGTVKAAPMSTNPYDGM